MSVRPKIFESVPSLSSRVSLLGSINGLTVARITFDFSYLRAYDPSGQPRCSSLSPLAYRTRTRLVPVPGSLRLLNQPCFDMFYISGMAAAATLGGKGHASARLGLICCKVYVSEGRNLAFLDSLSAIARSAQPNPGAIHGGSEDGPNGSVSVAATEDGNEGGCALVQRFNDPVYHRSNFTLGGGAGPVVETAIRLISHAIKNLDLTTHEATHPRLGVVDHVSIHPLGLTPITDATAAAHTIGRWVGERLQVPVLLYGQCSGRSLSDIRRSTGYFKGLQVDATVQSDVGPQQVDPRVGVMCVGAVPYVQNYNIRLNTTDRKLAAQVTKAVRSKDGGLPEVEALTLAHDGGHMEVACNLLDIGKTPPQTVLQVARQKAEELGIGIEEAYTIGFTSDQILAESLSLLRLDLR